MFKGVKIIQLPGEHTDAEIHFVLGCLDALGKPHASIRQVTLSNIARAANDGEVTFKPLDKKALGGRVARLIKARDLWVEFGIANHDLLSAAADKSIGDLVALHFHHRAEHPGTNLGQPGVPITRAVVTAAIAIFHAKNKWAVGEREIPQAVRFCGPNLHNFAAEMAILFQDIGFACEFGARKWSRPVVANATFVCQHCEKEKKLRRNDIVRVGEGSLDEEPPVEYWCEACVRDITLGGEIPNLHTDVCSVCPDFNRVYSYAF